jgi:hypothetical protein
MRNNERRNELFPGWRAGDRLDSVMKLAGYFFWGALAALSWPALPARAQEDISPPESAPLPAETTPEPSSEAEIPRPADPADAEIAFRFSDRFFATLLRREIDVTTPVRQTVLGAWVTGTAHTHAVVTNVFKPSDTDAQVYIVMTGSTVSDTVAAKSKARVYTTTTTQFRVWKLIHFEGESFVASPAGIETQTWSCTRGVGSTACLPLVNRIVRRVASQRAAEARSYTINLADWQARGRVLALFDQAVDRAIEDANVRLSIRQTLLARFGSLVDLKYRLSTQPNYLEIYVNIASDEDPKRPPIVDDWRQSPMEIWIHTYVEDQLLPPILQDWGPRYNYFIERAVQRAAQSLTPEQVQFKLQFTPQLDWVMMRFGDELLDRLDQRVQARRQAMPRSR